MVIEVRGQWLCAHDSEQSNPGNVFTDLRPLTSDLCFFPLVPPALLALRLRQFKAQTQQSEVSRGVAARQGLWPRRARARGPGSNES